MAGNVFSTCLGVVGFLSLGPLTLRFLDSSSSSTLPQCWDSRGPGPRSCPRSLSWANPDILGTSNTSLSAKDPQTYAHCPGLESSGPCLPHPHCSYKDLAGSLQLKFQDRLFLTWNVCSPLSSQTLLLLKVKNQLPYLPWALCEGIIIMHPEFFQYPVLYPLSSPTGCSLCRDHTSLWSSLTPSSDSHMASSRKPALIPTTPRLGQMHTLSSHSPLCLPKPSLYCAGQSMVTDLFAPLGYKLMRAGLSLSPLWPQFHSARPGRRVHWHQFWT